MLKSNTYKAFIKKLILFGSPVIALALAYFIFDPFHVLRIYEAYPDNYLKSYNRNRISTQIFLNNNDSVRYQSFIFGSSRSSVFYTQDWGRFIGDSTPYHFDASNESISGIYGKIKFIDSQKNKIKNALLIFDNETFTYAVDSANSIIHIQDWRWSGQNRLLYHLTFFKAFFKNAYFWKFFDTQIFEKYRPYMYGSFENKHMLYTPVRNDFIFQGYLDQIKNDSIGYYKRDLFYARSSLPQIGEQSIKPYQEQYLREIKEIFDKNNTQVRIVFGPNYDQVKVNSVDVKLVADIFGESEVFDYTGINEMTNPISNYYEIYHYKPVVARKILEELYAEK